MSLGSRINEIRKQKGLSIDDLCALSGLPKGTLSKITAGITPNPTLDTVRAIANALECKLDDLDDNQSTKNSPSTAEPVPGEKINQEIMRLAGGLSPEQQDLFLALLRLTAARNQGLSPAALVSAGVAALRAGLQDQHPQ